MGFRVGMFILTPLFVIDTIASLIITIIYKLNALAIAAGIMGIIGIVVIVPCAIYSYKEYKREERRLIRKYGKDFVKNASFFVD